MSDTSPELHAEHEQQELYSWLSHQLQDYKEVFDLGEDDLQNRRILEIGAYDRRVAAACILEGITKEVYSLDPAYIQQKEGYADIEATKGVVEKLPSAMQEEIKKRTVCATAEQAPFDDQSFDLVLGRSVNFDSPEQLASRMQELLRVGKEVRLYPVDDANRQAYETALKQLSKELKVENQFKTTLETDVNTGSRIRHVKEDVLILRKQKDVELREKHEIERVVQDFESSVVKMRDLVESGDSSFIKAKNALVGLGETVSAIRFDGGRSRMDQRVEEALRDFRQLAGSASTVCAEMHTCVLEMRNQGINKDTISRVQNMLDRLNRLQSIFVRYQENLTQMSDRIQSWAEDGCRDGIFSGHIAEELSNGVARSKAHLKSSVHELQMIISKWLNSGRDAYNITQKDDEYGKPR